MKRFANQLVLELKRDKKRAAILAVLAVAAAIAFGRLLLKKAGPSAAQATATVEAAPGTAARDRLGQAKADESAHDDYLTRIDTTIKRDIFVPPDRYFPPVGTMKKVLEAVNGGRATNKETAWKDAASMTLESTILSSTPKAIVDGQVVQVGDVMKGFRVVAIGPRSVTLERNGTTVTLEMKSEP
jgi:hypothetical protein